MGNEQQGGTSHHFIMDTSNDKSKAEQERRSPSLRKPVPTTTAKHSWQVARDISMDILSRKATRLSLKYGDSVTTIDRSPSPTKKHAPYRRPTIPEPFQIYRIPRMPTEKEASKVVINSEALCSFCDGSGVGNDIHCRICTKIYHSQCLFQRGYIDNESFSLSRLTKQEWSCPECNDLTQLLDQNEMHHLIDAFEQIDRNNDGYIVLEEFLSLQSNENISDGLELFIQYNSDSGRKLFSLMDTTQKGVVTWSDFILFYSCKLLTAKDKTKLTTKLTGKELVMARKLFLKDPRKTFDNNYDIIVTREYFTQIYKNLVQSLKKKYGIEFIDVILSDGNRSKNRLQEFSVMNWPDFLRELSLLLLLNRCNNDVIYSPSRRASIPPHLSKASIVSRSRFPSIEMDSPNREIFSRSITPGVTIANASCDESFRKHAKILEKLNQKSREDELRRKQMGSEICFTIVENLDGEENLLLPKLKANARDDRRAITDPWTSVKEIEQLRNQPIFVKTTHLKVL